MYKKGNYENNIAITNGGMPMEIVRRDNEKLIEVWLTNA